ncbi:rRNA biogenesis protein rrp5 [Malassezia sp. CBS 17886]|nr:rRNA biogenesis protein rrp5 [Malassezia sp. CBS 17886]
MKRSTVPAGEQRTGGAAAQKRKAVRGGEGAGTPSDARAKKARTGGPKEVGGPRTGGPKQGDGPRAPPQAPTPPHMAARPPTAAAFPRGGGTGLTPVEYRQTVLEGRKESAASQDLFAEATPRGKKHASAPAARRATKGKKAPPAARAAADKDAGVRVELLNYKRLTPGTKVLGSVLAVHPLAVVVSLCDQLVGHVPVTSISDTLTQRLQNALDTDAREGEDADERAIAGDAQDHTDARPPELRDIFHVGQWVRASVEAVHPPGTRRQWGLGREGAEYERESQRLQLSLEPRVVNEGVVAGDLVLGYTTSATVQSREDHGYELDVGLRDGTRAFLPYASMPADTALRCGAVILVDVDKDAGSGRVVRMRPTQASALVATAPSARAVLPGVAARALITAASPQGLSVKLFGMFDATADQFHLPPARRRDDAPLAPGKKLRVRVLWNMPADPGPADDADVAGARRIGVSAAPYVVALRAPRTPNDEPLPTAYPIGTMLQVHVTGVSSQWGLQCTVAGTDLGAFVHISRVADTHIDALAPGTGPYRVGSEHTARVTGYAIADRLLVLSMQPSVLAKTYMRVSQVPVGQVVRATVRRVTPQAIFVQLHGNVDGVVFPMHFSDVHLKHPEKKYKPNLEVPAKIIHTDPDRNRIVLTLKRSLVQSELPFVASLDDVRVGLVTHAVVTKHLQASMLVDLGGTVRAVVPYAEASDSTLSPAQRAELYPPGKVAKVRVTALDADTGRVVASVRQATPAYLAKLDVGAVDIGTRVSARVAAVHEGVVILELVPAGTRALLALPRLASARGTDVAALRASLHEGDVLDDLYAIDKNADKGLVVLGTHAPKTPGTPGVSTGGRHTARILERDDKQLACVARIGDGCRARLHVTECHDDLAHAALPAPGDTVSCVVLDTRRGGREADISLRASRMDPAVRAADPAVDSAAQLSEGMVLRGFLKAVTDKGAYVALGRRTDARVMIKELFDEYVKDFAAKLHVGGPVRGTVLQVLPSGQVEFSLKRSRLGDDASAADRGGSAPSAERARTAGTLGGLRVGDKVRARVRGTTEYGVFVQVEGTNTSGLCHRSELSDTKASNAVRAFAVGDKVKAVVLKVDEEKHRVSFGLKPSYFEDVDWEDKEESDSADEREDEEGEASEEENAADDNPRAEDMDDREASEEDTDDDDESPAADTDDGAAWEEDTTDDDALSAADATGDAPVDPIEVEAALDAAPTSLQRGFRFGAATDTPTDVDASDDDAPSARTKKRTHAAVEDITADLSSKKLQSSTDFERVLLGSPNSSYLWIQFMSFHLQLGDVDRARQVARRAIQTINFREEQEKLNVWIALLNLENMYGSPDTLHAVFKEAVQLNDAREVHLRLLAIYEQGDKIDDADALFRRTAKKFGHSASVWVQWYQFYLRHGRPDDAHALVPRSLQSLERAKHIKALTAYALSEYKFGDVEHARTLFETLVERHPKRLDIWWQYIDQEVRRRDIPAARSLLERVMTTRRNTTKQTKSLLHKWLAIEKRIGDAAGVAAVLERARAFVAGIQKGEGAGGGEEAEREEEGMDDGDWVVDRKDEEEEEDDDDGDLVEGDGDEDHGDEDDADLVEGDDDSYGKEQDSDEEDEDEEDSESDAGAEEFEYESEEA